MVTHGYRNPQDNNAALLGGHLNSGDLAYTDEDGRIYIAGRAKDLIIRNGHKSASATPGRRARSGSGPNPTFMPGIAGLLRLDPEELRAFAEPRISEQPAWPKQYYLVLRVPAFPARIWID